MQNLIFFKLVCSSLPDAFYNVFFLDQEVKIVISKGFSQSMEAITQHAIVEKRVGEGMFFPFFFPLFMFWLVLKAYGDAPHVL